MIVRKNDGMRPRPTLTDVAAAAGVSVATASRALGGQGALKPETRARVMARADELGYTRVGENRGRPRARSALIDLVLGHFDDPWSDEIAAGARAAAADAGYDLVLTVERDSVADDWPQRIRARGSAGVVLGLIRPTRAQLDALQHARIPVVLLDPRSDPVVPVASVGTTDAEGGRDAARHLAAGGARRLIVVAGRPRYRYGRARVTGFLAGAAEHAPQSPVTVVDVDWEAGSVRAALAGTLGDGPVGVFAITDALARGVYAAAADAGLTVPDDVRIVGFDDARTARGLVPPLSSVRQPLREIAARAVELVDAAARGEVLAPERVELPTTLRVRGSSTV